jgi:hypothetical protein
MIISIASKKENSISLHDKSPEETRNARIILQQNKDYI